MLTAVVIGLALVGGVYLLLGLRPTWRKNPYRSVWTAAIVMAILFLTAAVVQVQGGMESDRNDAEVCIAVSKLDQAQKADLFRQLHEAKTPWGINRLRDRLDAIEAKH